MKEKFKYYLLILLCIANFLLGIYNLTQKKPVIETSRYEIVRLNDTNYIVYDIKTEKIWQKFVDPSSGPTDFQEIDLPNY